MAPTPPLSVTPLLTIVLPSLDICTAKPCDAAPMAPVPTSCVWKTSVLSTALYVYTNTAPASVFVPGAPIAMTLPSAETATAAPSCWLGTLLRAVLASVHALLAVLGRVKMLKDPLDSPRLLSVLLPTTATRPPLALTVVTSLVVPGVAYGMGMLATSEKVLVGGLVSR